MSSDEGTSSGGFGPGVGRSGLAIDRRGFMAYFSAAGLSATLLPGVLWSHLAAAQESEISIETIRHAEKLAGLEFTDEERENLRRGVKRLVGNYRKLREVDVPNNVVPALQFNPILPGMTFNTERRAIRLSEGPLREVPDDLEDVAFWTVMDLSRAIEAGKISSVALTKMYLERLKRYDPLLKCVITLTEDLAMKQARRADDEIAAGKYRGPLHGIPWGAKDLLAARGYPTTWGAMPFKDQVIDEDATVVKRLEEAGAVLVAKLTLGALAQGDIWYGGRTNNPWNPKRGSSGSSAGPASATAAGLVGFAIGSETNGSITSPATRCGVTGLRPTFGRVSRHGAMALSWSMDKLGPLCRSVEDCAVVLDAICGPDGQDLTVTDLPFNWDAKFDVRKLRVGYVESGFNTDGAKQGNNERTLETLKSLGIELQPIQLPDLPFNSMGFILSVEAATAFDDLTRSGRDDELVNQGGTAWPATFRRARMVPAVEYIRAMRVRTLLMRQMAELMNEVDVYVTPTLQSLYLGNFTGHPIISVPNGFTDRDEPTSIGFVGRLYGEAELLALASAYQNATDYHLKYPTLDA